MVVALQISDKIIRFFCRVDGVCCGKLCHVKDDKEKPTNCIEIESELLCREQAQSLSQPDRTYR